MPVCFGLLALVAPSLVIYDVLYQLGQPGNALNGSSLVRLITVALVVTVFWLITGSLLIRRYQQGIIRLLFVHGQVLAITMVYPLAHPSPWDQPPGLLRFSIVGFYFLAPLTLHMHITFPVHLGTHDKRRNFLIFLYLVAITEMLSWLSGSLILKQVGEVLTLSIFTSSIAVLVYAYVYRATADDRRRLRIIWFVTLLAIVSTNVFYFVPGLYGWPVHIAVWLVGLLLMAVPVSYLYAITRENLFGIDRLLNRSLVYLILTFSIFAIYLAPLLYLYNVLSGDWLVQALVSAGLTLLIGWNFTWLRTRVERLVTRFFYGSWYDYPGVVETISDALARSTDRAHLIDVLTRLVPELMNLKPGQFWIGTFEEVLPKQPAPQMQFSFSLEGKILARWVIGSRLDGSQFTSIDQRILKTLARQTEVALHNVLLIERLRQQLDEIRANRETLAQTQRRLLRSREEERARLARELHDGPLQTLIGMNIQLGMLQASLPSPDREGAGGDLHELRTEVRSLLDELRAVCAELRPPMLDTLGLGAAMRALTEEWTVQHGIAVQFDLPEDSSLQTLPDEVAVNLYRVAQEALSNISRHAAAGRVVIVLKRDIHGLELCIQDDGRGFCVPQSLHELAVGNHFGLVGMRERVELIGGTLAVESQPGQGTMVRVSL